MDQSELIQRIYPLSPLQQGILLHYLKGEESGSYIQQISFDIRGKLDIDLFEKSFDGLINHYDVFRTIFVYEGFEEPRQVLLRERHSQIIFEDISSLSREQQLTYIQEFKQSDRKRGFNLSSDIPARLSVLKKDEESYTVIWCFHHIIIDGWGTSIVEKAFFESYCDLMEGIKSRGSLHAPGPRIPGRKGGLYAGGQRG